MKFTKKSSMILFDNCKWFILSFKEKKKESNFHFIFTLWGKILKTAICFGSGDIVYCSLFIDEINLFLITICLTVYNVMLMFSYLI